MRRRCHVLAADGRGRFEEVLVDDGENDRVIGGRAPRTAKRRLRAMVEEAVPVPVETVREGSYAGVSQDNVVNRLAAGSGIQLEQGPETRDEHWRAVAETVAAFYEGTG